MTTVVEDSAGPSGALHHRVRYGIRRGENWLQLVRFVVVGASGFAANVGTYTLAVHLLGLDFRLAALVGLCAGVGNNFVWHRMWTFGARDGHAGFQAMRFTVVYGVTFVVGLGILQLLVDAGSSKVMGQAVSQILITPLNFLGHKLWSFDD
ncbi:MAG: GtrA family protein [Solirubrobacterales bacterium]|nr:GtrA family protein [Solirubrobacterales bacterium]